MVYSAERKKPSKARGTYKVYSDRDRLSIGKNEIINGTASIVRRWKKIYPHINESTVLGFKKPYEGQIKNEIRQKKYPMIRLCLLGNKIDPLVQKYLIAIRCKGGVVNSDSKITNKTILTLRERPS